MEKLDTQECMTLPDFTKLINQSAEKFIIIDVRSPEEFSENHIPGAINIPLLELASRQDELARNATVITACGKGGGRSAQGAAMLGQMGFGKAYYLCGGTFGWFESQDQGRF